MKFVMPFKLNKVREALSCIGIQGAVVTLMSVSPALALAAPELPPQGILERLERLEAQNAQLREEIRALRQESEARLSERENEQAETPKDNGQAKPTGDDEATKQASLIEKLSGISVDAALTTVWQKASSLPRGAKPSEKLNYRADLAVSVPLEPVAGVEHKLFAHTRMGQGEGLNGTLGLLGHLNVPNAAAFHASGANSDDATFILGEAWYQAALPLGSRDSAYQKLEVTFGKMDLFGFFDRNEVAGDETTQFLNAVLVHNPLLDAGGGVGADANGFQPGAIISYQNEYNKETPWRLSLGLFGAGDKGSNYQKTTDSPLMILQAEKTLKLGARMGNVRLYGWNRRKVSQFDSGLYGRHTGLGLSVDQEISEGVRLFGRYGRLVSGKLPMKWALAAGLEVHGKYWGRPTDRLGVAGSWLHSSRAYRRAGGEGYLTDTSTVPDFTFRPSGAERVAEMYYRLSLTPQFSLTPDLQWIQRGGANPDAGSVVIFGVRVNIAY